MAEDLETEVDAYIASMSSRETDPEYLDTSSSEYEDDEDEEYEEYEDETDV